MMAALKEVASRARAMIARGVVTSVDDAPQCQIVQAEVLDDEVTEGERFGEYGFTSVPLAGAEALILFVGGARSHPIVAGIVDRRSRPTDLQPGEVVIFDDQGQRISILRDRIEIETDKPVKIIAEKVEVTADEVTVTAQDVTITGDNINLGGTGGAKVARVGDTVAGGVITSGSDKVKAA